MDKAESILASLVSITDRQGVNIGLLLRCMYGVVSIVLLAVGGALIHLVIK